MLDWNNGVGDWVAQMKEWRKFYGCLSDLYC